MQALIDIPESPTPSGFPSTRWTAAFGFPSSV